MAYNSLRRGPRRPGANRRSYSPSRPHPGRPTRPPKKRGTYINPERYVKAANPAQTGDYRSANAFADFAIHPLLKSNIASKGYQTPSEIQDKTIALGLSGRDVVGVANTGTGKTAAFAIPILNQLVRDRTSRALIMAPTRELALQIEEQCRLLAKNSGLSGALLIGGMPMGRQISALRNGANIVIGTPGRIKDHIEKGILELIDCHMIVLDEVDRMLDMGFIKDIRFILSKLPEQRQSFFFSATLSPEINNLIQGFTNNPATVNVKAGETTDNVHQDVIAYDSKPQRLELLSQLLAKPELRKVLVFGETKYGVERLARELKRRELNAESIHGGKNQGQRKRAMDGFRDGSVNILVATDVAARGIDVVDITHVINFDEPHTYTDYVHRIGRAGRAGRIGHALTFVETRSSLRF